MLTLLTSLNVSNNRLAELDDDLKDFVQLKVLDVSYNKIADLGDVSCVRALAGQRV